MQQVIEGFSLSLQQARVWALQQEQDVYRSHCAMRIKGPVHLPTLRRAIQCVLTRHEVYRTSLRRVLGMRHPLQVVHASPLWLWQEVDLRHLSSEPQHEQRERLALDSLATPLDWEQGQLIVCTLLAQAPQDHLLLVHLPALLADAASLSLFFHELATLYPHPRLASGASLEDFPYLQFSETQAALLEERDEQELRHYASWWEQTSANLAALTLPFEHNQQIGFSPRVETVSLAPEECTHLQAFLQQQSCSWSAFLLVCWQLLLSRLTGREELLLGVEVDGRSFEDLVELSGLLSKELPLLCCLSADLSLAELLAQTQEAVQDLLMQYPAFSWEDLERVAPLRYPWSFAFREDPQIEHSAGVSWALQHWQACCEPFKVKLIAVRTADSLRIEMHYDGSRFEQRDIERLAKQFLTLLTQAVRQPEADLAALEILNKREREYLLVEWNQTQEAYPEEQCVYQLIEQQVQRTPDATAVLSAQGQLTYQALDRRANQLAHALRSRGVQPEVLVGFCLPRGPECLVTILGILKAGGAYLPMETDQPRVRLASLAREANLSLLLTTSALQHLMPQDLPLLLLDTEARTLSQYCSEVAPPSQLEPQNLAYVLYTSGSTGRPKGVMISQQGLLHYVHWAARRYEVAGGTGSSLHSRFSFDLTVTSLFTPLVVGRAVELVSEEQGLQGLAETLRQGQDFSLVKLTPTHLEMLNQMLAPSELAGKTRMLIVGGEALRWESLALWLDYAPETRIINEYGPTETVVGCCVYEAATFGATTGAVPIGRPIANTQLYVLDAHLRPVPVGVTGEVYIGGIGVARGYLHRGDLTAERFLPNPFSQEPGSRLYRTGDLGRHRGDGELEYVGRLDSQVKVRGYRIELGEIEAVLVQHSGIGECVVQVRVGAGGEPELVAYVLRAPGQAQFSVGELRGYLGEYLPQYMVPTSFVVLISWPLTSNGKVDRQALLALESTAEEASGVEKVPHTGTQEMIAGLWCSVLGRTHVGLWENFFELGGHSLLATRLISRLKSVMGVEVPVHVVFDQPTVAGLAQAVEQALRKNKGLEIPPLVAVARPEAIPLSFAQQRLWFLDQLEPGSTAYHIPIIVKACGRLNVAALGSSLSELVHRHENLRTSFQTRDGLPVQIIHPLGKIPLPLIDVQGLAVADREIAVQELVRQEVQRIFNLAHGPLLRTTLVRLSIEEHVILLNMHHIISDAWSENIFISEIISMYNAYTVGGSITLPALPIQYADYACWQRSWLQGEVLQRQLDYWTQHLSGLAPLDLPLDHLRPVVQTFNGASRHLLLPARLNDALKQLSQREGTTLFMTLLAAFQVLLARYSRQSEIAVGTPIANRTHVESEGLIGFFTNTLVMRTDLVGNPTFQEVLGRVREVALAAYAHQDVPFEKIVEVLQPQRDLSRSPLFQVMFISQYLPQTGEQLEGLTLEAFPYESVSAKFDLILSMLDSGQEMGSRIEYNTDLFDESTIDLLLKRWQLLLETLVSDPQQHLSEISLLTEAEQQQVLVEWNATRADYPAPDSLHRLFEEQVSSTSETVAASTGDEHLTYGELNRRANQLARHLRAAGVRPDLTVGICVERSLQMLIGVLGILKAGGAYVPLDPTYPQERLAYMFQDAQITVLVTQQQMVASLPDHQSRVVDLDSDWETIACEEIGNLDLTVDSENLAYIIYTSGSTGQPKGIAMPHRALVNLMQWQKRHSVAGPGSRTLQFTSLSFDVACQELFATWSIGGSLVLIENQLRLDMRNLVQRLAEAAIERLFLPFVALQQLALAAGVQAELLTHLREILTAGEQLQASEPVRTFFAEGSRAVLINQYGPAESHVVTALALDPEPLRWLPLPPIGTPIANTQIYLLSESMQPQPVGLPGEICIGGAGLARGYFQRSELSAERFVPNPFSSEPGARLYRTGDLARHLPDGSIEFLGRRDQQVKIRGYRIELGEIEAILSQHPGVSESVVTVREEGAEDRRLVAYIVARQDPPPTSDDLRRYLQQRLPDYMLPAAFVHLTALPLTPSGKVQRSALPHVEGLLLGRATEYVAPQSGLERLIAAIWQDVLHIEQVGLHDNFFDLGGHSLLAIAVHHQLHTALKRHIALLELFQYPTVSSLALALSQKQESQLTRQGIQQRTEKRQGMMKRQQELRKSQRSMKQEKGKQR